MALSCLEAFRKTWSLFSKVVGFPGFNIAEKYMSTFSERVKHSGHKKVYKKHLWPKSGPVTLRSCPSPSCAWDLGLLGGSQRFTSFGASLHGPSRPTQPYRGLWVVISIVTSSYIGSVSKLKCFLPISWMDEGTVGLITQFRKDTLLPGRMGGSSTQFTPLAVEPPSLSGTVWGCQPRVGRLWRNL